jgi:hypothetical protein
MENYIVINFFFVLDYTNLIDLTNDHIIFIIINITG